MKARILFILLLFNLSYINAQQQFTQTIRGTVIDADSRQPLFGATIHLLRTEPVLGAIAEDNGRFRIENVPIGRYDIKVSYIGYKELVLPNVEVTSGKEVVLQIELTESFIERDAVIIQANKQKDKPNNDMSTVSARLFTVEETQRFAGSLGDPARMASNFAGVLGANDARNDIIIRGNSPSGLLWRFEGIDIPSPNHFSAQGTTGGPISMLNNNMLRNSDFFTGAWPAEYGNAISGVFDLKLRPGNNEKNEYTFQMGINGIEAMAEGPLSKKTGASFIASYRYSMLGIMQWMGINLGTAGVPRYQDISFKTILPAGKLGQFEVFGIGGISNIEVLDSKRTGDDFTFGVLQKRDVRFGSKMGVGGIAHVKMFKNNSYIRTTFVYTAEEHSTNLDSLNPDNKPIDLYNESGLYSRRAIHSVYNKKINANNTIRTGIIFSNLAYNNFQESYSGRYASWVTLNNAKGNTFLAQPYTQWRHSFTEKLTSNVGVHLQYFTLNNTYSVEPRAGLRYALNNRQSLSFGYGLHGQIQPLHLYFYEKPFYDSIGNLLKYERTNQQLGFTRSHHFVTAYDYVLAENLRLKTEVYYQYLFNVPVHPFSSYSTLNNGADFGIQLVHDLQNTGNGRNYGLEITLEKFFAKQYFFLITTSLFNSEYKGSDGIWRNTAFNSKYIFNALAGKEFNIGTNKKLNFSGRVTTAGGRWGTPIDPEASQVEKRAVYIESEAYTLQYPAYLRLDGRISFKINSKKITQEIAFDVQNITNRQNVLTEIYDLSSNQTRREYQLGLLPVFLYRVQF